MIKNVKMDWEDERHTFTFHTNGDAMEALDFLGDFIGSLEALKKQISFSYNFEDNLPTEFKVYGGCSNTHIYAVTR